MKIFKLILLFGLLVGLLNAQNFDSKSVIAKSTILSKKEKRESAEKIKEHQRAKKLASKGKIVKAENEEMEEKDGMMEAMMQEIELTKDPATGQVPLYKLVQARQDAENIYNTFQNQNGIAPVANIVWSERGPNKIGGRTRALLFDKKDVTNKTVWTSAVGGGLYNCTDIDAATPIWNKVNDFFGNINVCALIQHPTFPDTMYFGTGEGFFNADALRGAGIWRTSNNGVTWTQLPSLMTGTVPTAINRLVVTSQGKVYAATDMGVYSADLSNPGLSYFGNWHLVNLLPAPGGKYTSLIFSGNKLYANLSDPISGGDKVYVVDNTSSERDYNVSN